MPAARLLQLGHDHAGEAAQVGNRQVDLAEQQDEDDAVGQHRRAGHLRDDVVEVDGGEEVLRREGEDDDDDRQADDHRRAAELAALDVLPEPGCRALDRLGDVERGGVGRHGGVGRRDPGNLRRLAGSDRVDDLVLRHLRAREQARVAPEPKHGDAIGDLEDVVEVVRDQDDREALLAEPLDEREHLLGLRDAERRGRLVEDDELRVPHHRPGDRDRLALPTRERGHLLADRPDRRDAQRLQRLGGALLHHRLLKHLDEVVRLAPEIHVLDDVEVVAEREVLVDDLDPEVRRVPRAGDVNAVAFEVDLARVDRVDAGDGFDQRRLARAVVTDEGHHLAPPHLEIDVRERLHGAEGLGDAAKLEDWGFGGDDGDLCS